MSNKQNLTYTKKNQGGKAGGPYYDPTKRRWINALGQVLALGKGYYSKGSNTYQQYNSDGTVTRYSAKKYAQKKNNDIITQRKNLERKFAIPFIKEKQITLSQAGKATGATFSTNLLDSVAKYGKLAGIPLKEAIGVVNKESTFGAGYGRGLGHFYDHANSNKTWTPQVTGEQLWSPVVLTSNWHYINDNPYQEYIKNSEELTQKQLDEEAKARRKKSVDRYDYGRRKFQNDEASFKVFEHPLLNAFKYHKSGGYNTLEAGYSDIVRNRGNEVYQSPEFLQWLNSSPYAY